MLIILYTWEAEVRRMSVKASSGKKVCKTPSQSIVESSAKSEILTRK
jgi:hypothetical protein